jgi:hypothetical protein
MAQDQNVRIQRHQAHNYHEYMLDLFEIAEQIYIGLGFIQIEE